MYITKIKSIITKLINNISLIKNNNVNIVNKNVSNILNFNFYNVIRLYSIQKLATHLDRRIGRRIIASGCPFTSILIDSS